MKLKLIITCFLCAITLSFVQNSGSIKGKVVDKKTNEPLPYVNIILKENNKIVTEGSKVVVGGNDIYTPVCRKHFRKLTKLI